MRYNALSRVLEAALQKDSIPNRIVGGHKFFERMEIKDMLAYLQLAETPGFTVSQISITCITWPVMTSAARLYAGHQHAKEGHRRQSELHLLI